MNLVEASGAFRRAAFRIARAAIGYLPSRRISAFGSGENRIGSVLVVNLNRQTQRWQQVTRELQRFRTFDGTSLLSISARFSAVDARDGRAVAATADVDSIYCLGHQLFVQPDTRLAKCFSNSEPVKMTRQEVAVARSHIEVWKTIANGIDAYVLVLEDDVWFTWNAATEISAGWQAALERCRSKGGPHLLYLSYQDAGGTAERADACKSLFRPVRGLWFLSGYVLSREGAAALLRAMPVVGPVDMWMNYRFQELGAFALTSPAILQRADTASDNSYSMLPYLARAGIVEAGVTRMAPAPSGSGPVLAWTSEHEREALPMALAMLGLRVRVFDGNEAPIEAPELHDLLTVFDVIVNAAPTREALASAVAAHDTRFVTESDLPPPHAGKLRLPPRRTLQMPQQHGNAYSWEPLCAFLGLAAPIEAYPAGAPTGHRVFRDDRKASGLGPSPEGARSANVLDDSPWVLPPGSYWHPQLHFGPPPPAGERLVFSDMTTGSDSFHAMVETFPGNLAAFSRDSIRHDVCGAHLVLSETKSGSRPYQSGSFRTVDTLAFGRFEARIKAARGSGLVTGFFLHRDAPRQEIDVELPGSDPTRMLVNVYFNPGDEGASMTFGYRGSPHRIDLGFDATLDFHVYAIDWRPGQITWSVDGRVVHERVGWDPTPIPHLPMRLYMNLWAPRSADFGNVGQAALPASASFADVSVCS